MRPNSRLCKLRRSLHIVYIFSKLGSWERNLDEVIYRIAVALCYTKEEELSLASDILQNNSYSGYDIAYQIFEKNNEILKLLDLRKARVYSAKEASALVDEYIKLGRDDLASEYTIKLVTKKYSDLLNESNSYAERICDIAFKSLTKEQLFELYSTSLPFHFKNRILEEAEEAGNSTLYTRILTDFIKAGDPKHVVLYYTRLKAFSQNQAMSLYQNMAEKQSDQYAELCFAEKNYTYLFNLLDQYNENIRFSCSKRTCVFDYDDRTKYYSYATRLEVVDPERVYAYYWNQVEILTKMQGRKNYYRAVRCLKHAYKLNNKADIENWSSRFTAYMEENRTKRLLKDIVKNEASELYS